MTILLESNKEEKKSMEERLDNIQQESKERDRLFREEIQRQMSIA